MAALATRARPVAGSRSDTLAGFLPALTAALLVAAGAELFLLRLISRVGIHIPALPWARTAYTAAVAIGTYAFPVAAVLAMATLAVTALLALRRSPAAVAPLLLLGLQGWLLVVGAAAIGVTAHHIAVLACLAAVGGIAARSALPRPTLGFLGAVVAAQALAFVGALLAGQAGAGGGAWPITPAIAGELALLAAALATPVALAPPPRRRRALVGAAGAGLVVALAFAGNGSTTRILALWTFGLATPAPGAVYALVAAALTLSGATLWARGRRMEAAALALVALGGFGPSNSYQTDLLLSGLLLLAAPTTPPAAPD